MSSRCTALVALTSIALSLGCGPRLPPSHADPEGIAAGDPLANDPVRAQIHELHVVCNDRLEAIRDSVRVRTIEDVLYIALAFAIASLAGGTVGGGSGENAALTGPGGQLSYRCTPGAQGDDPSHGGCNSPGAPMLSVNDEGAVRTNRPVDSSWTPRRRIETINAAIDAMDDFIFSNPDPDEWGDDERTAYERLLSSLGATCRNEESSPEPAEAL